MGFMGNNKNSDPTLMARVVSGDVVAFETLYDRYASPVMGLAYKVLGNRAQAEEIVQESFWTIWEKAETFDPEQGNFASWLFRIARNLAIDRVRRLRARPEPVLFDEAYGYEDSQVDVPGSVWASLKYEQVRQAMGSLPEEQRVIIELAYFQGKTRREIAAEQELPLGTVHTRARLALQKLKQALQAEGLENQDG
jgi:RNA polymerase sigma-70 factor (ECF subfamily)